MNRKWKSDEEFWKKVGVGSGRSWIQIGLGLAPGTLAGLTASCPSIHNFGAKGPVGLFATRARAPLHQLGGEGGKCLEGCHRRR